MKRKLNIIISLTLLFTAFHLNAQDWIVPEDQSSLSNPMDYNLRNVEQGKTLYLANCKSCHGDPGKGNVLPLVPLPPDVVSDQMQANGVGDLFYKITSGRGAMPQFETVLSDDERWNIVNFIMNYNSSREALLIELPPIKAQIWAAVNEEDAVLEVFIEEQGENGATTPLEGVNVNVSTRKTFGNLKIGETITGENGRSEFKVPEHIIGDEEGKVNLVVSLNEDYEASSVILDNARIATPKSHTALIRQGVIWSTNENMPLWLTVSFILMVLGAWITIIYVIVQVVNIRKLN